MYHDFFVYRYKKAEKLLYKCRLNNDEEEEKYVKFMLKVFVNLCICFNHPKIKRPATVCTVAHDAFDVCRNIAHNSPKLYYKYVV